MRLTPAAFAILFACPALCAQAPAPTGQAGDPREIVSETPPVFLRDPLPSTSPAKMGGMDGMAGVGGRGGMGGGPPGYDAYWYPSASVRNRAADLGFVRQGLSVGVPVWRQDGDMLMATASVRHTDFSTDAILPDSLRSFPDQLWNINLGGMYMHRFENGWTGNVMFGVGSASDKPFNSINEMTGTIGAMVRIPANEGRDAWTLGLMYQAGGQANFPIPVVSYMWNPSDRLRVNVGLPLSVMYRPTEDLTLDVSYVPLLNVNARATQVVCPGLKVYGGYAYANESYLLADRESRNDRFFGLEQKVFTGVKWDALGKLTLGVEGGYSFGRIYGEGESAWSSLKDRVNVSPGPFLGAELRMKF